MNTQKNPEKNVFGFVSMAVVPILFFCAIAASGQNAPDSNLSAAKYDGDMLFMLLQIQADVQGNLTDLDLDVANAAQNLSITGLEGTAAREALHKLLETNSNLVEAVTFNTNGTIIVAECKGCKGGEGADISSQEQIAHILQTKTPVFSKQIMLAEGYKGTFLAYPVFSPQGEFLGGISAIIEPDELMNTPVALQLQLMYNRSNVTDPSFWLMDLDGQLLYDEDASQIGKYLFEDSLYKPFPNLLDLGHRIVAERSGYGYYSYYSQVTEGNKTAVNKECYWTTVGLHGREWRLVVTKIMQ